MKAYAKQLSENPVFVLFMQGTLAYTVLTAVILITVQIPPEIILDTNLREILMIFEGD